MQQTSKIVYKMIESTNYVEDNGMVTTYGVSCGAEKESAGQKPAQSQSVSNISTRSAFVEELVERLNNHAAAPIHLKDLIDDYLP